MSIPKKDWRWFGHAGHFCAARSCSFHLHTRVGNYRISTVGDYYPGGGEEREIVGYHRYFETFVFLLDGECTHCTDEDCGQGEVSSWSEIDSEPANEWPEAERNHMAMCRKYAEALG